MRPGRLALLNLVIGAWLAISGATIVGAVMSFRSAPAASEAATPLEGPRAARVHAMTFNGEMFRASARAQLVLAALALVLAAWIPVASRASLGMIVGAAVLTALIAFVVTPRSNAIAQQRIAALQAGRLEPPEPAQEARFKALHRAYGLMDLTKSILLLGASWTAVRAASKRAG